METIHVRANPKVLNLLYDKINAISKNGDEIEVLVFLGWEMSLKKRYLVSNSFKTFDLIS